MPDADVNVTPGAGAPIRAYQKTSGDYDQYVRTVYGTARATNLSNLPWTVTTAGLTTTIPGDTSRVGLILTSAATGIVYINFNSTVPSSTAYDWLLNPGDRWEVTHEFVQLVQSWVGAVAGGFIYGAGATCA
jgi:hypothetical protein